MKRYIVFSLLAFFFISFPGKAHADDVYKMAAEQFGAFEMESMLTEEEKQISGEIEFDGNFDAGGALARLWENLVSKIVEELRDNVKHFTLLVAVALLSTLVSALCTGKEISLFSELIGCGSAALIFTGTVDSIVTQTVDAMYRLSDYSKAALPVVFTAAAAGGAISSSATKFAAISFALDVLMSVSQKLIIPVIYAFLALAMSSALFPNPTIISVQKLCKWSAGVMMSGMTLAFTAYISMIGAIGSAVDTAAVKAARSVISGALPVVGGMISDTSAMVLSAAGVVRSTAGVFGLITVSIMCIGPFALLSVKMFLLKAVAAVADSMENSRLSTMFSGLGTAMGLLLGLLGSCGIMLFISLTAGMKAVNI